MEQNKKTPEPDNTAVRTALWRALHVQVDATPHILEDEIGLRLIAPPEDCKERPDMKFTKRLRASIVARARFIEDLIIEQSQHGISRYVILGAGLDTFAQRRPEIASRLQIYEIDQTDTLTWKQQRLIELGYGIPESLHFVTVDFERTSWWTALLEKGFDTSMPAVVVCTGVTLYLTKEAIIETLQTIKKFAAGSVVAVTFYLPIELLKEEDKPLMEMSLKGAAASGTPMLSFFNSDEILALARETGFKEARILSTKELETLYFAGRTDDLLPATGEVFLVATV
jgi:methyltransferase (TIGR00027 family)